MQLCGVYSSHDGCTRVDAKSGTVPGGGGGSYEFDSIKASSGSWIMDMRILY